MTPASNPRFLHDSSASPPGKNSKRHRSSNAPMDLADEIEFALSSVTESNLPSIRRSGLFSLLTICANHRHRDLLRKKGLTNLILATITVIDLNDEPSSLAAVAIFYFLTGNGNADLLLERTENLKFIVKYLNPTSPDCKQKQFNPCKAINKKVVSSKIRVLLANNNDPGCLPREEICAKWVALKTIENCSSPNISFKDLPYSFNGASDFSEKLCEHGVIDGVFNVMRDCSSFLEEKDSTAAFKTMELLSVTLRIVENFAILGKRNQTHLLGLRGEIKQGITSSLSELLIRIVKRFCATNVNIGSNGDPYAFEETKAPPSKWEALKKQRNLVRDKDLGRKSREFHRQENEKETHSLAIDCLISCVKVLMNLANDSSVGSRQIASFGGLEAISSLTELHFPSSDGVFDQKLDLLVAILGFLVNMVEKSENNRSRLATSGGKLIPFLCSIFLKGESTEKMILEGYAALLLGFLSTESKCIRGVIAGHLPSNGLMCLVPVMERFMAFHITFHVISADTEKAVSELIESCRV